MTNSTNDEAVRLAREGSLPGTVVWADVQTAGRGRMGRKWEGGKGNVYLSVVVRPNLPAALTGRLSVACGLALADALRNETWQPVRTKWPNDLYLYGRKLGGILVETGSAPGGRVDWAVVGVGINVAGHPEVPAPGQPATSLAENGGAGDIETLVPVLASAIVRAVSQVESDDGWAQIARKWTRTDLAVGPVTVLESGECWPAIGLGLAEDGALSVDLNGEVRVVTAGEVSIRTA